MEPVNTNRRDYVLRSSANGGNRYLEMAKKQRRTKKYAFCRRKDQDSIGEIPYDNNAKPRRRGLWHNISMEVFTL
jgi:hypothetical protein